MVFPSMSGHSSLLATKATKWLLAIKHPGDIPEAAVEKQSKHTVPSSIHQQDIGRLKFNTLNKKGKILENYY